MEFINVNGINGVDNTPQQQKKKEIPQDNTYQGEKITMDTANPAEMLGRSMVVHRNTDKTAVEESKSVNEPSHLSGKIYKGLKVVKSYLGKARLELVGLGYLLNGELSKLFVSNVIAEMDEETIAIYKKMVEDIKQELLNEPETLIRSTKNKEEKQKEVELFFKNNELDIIAYLDVMGKDCLMDLMKHGVVYTKDLLDFVHKFDKSNSMNVKRLINSKNIDGKPFSPEQKNDILKIYECADYGLLDVKSYNQIVQGDEIDLNALKKLYLRSSVDKKNRSFVDKIDKEKFSNRNISHITNISDALYFSKENFKVDLPFDEKFKLFDDTATLYDRVYSSIEKYVNGDYTENRYNLPAYAFFQHSPVVSAVYTFDKEAVDVLLRRRFFDASNYLIDLTYCKNLDLVRKLAKSTDVNGNQFTPNQKLDFLYIVNLYTKNKLNLDKIKEMADAGKVDLQLIKSDAFSQILKNAGLTDEEISQIPYDKLTSWNLEYVQFLADVDKHDDFADILRAANLDDFERYIHDETNEYGVANAETRKMYDEFNLDYEKWIHPSKENEIDFIEKDKNEEKLNQIAVQIVEDMNALMKTPIKGLIKKRFPDCVKEDTFFLPSKYSSSKSAMKKFLTQLTDNKESQMNDVWNRAKGNLNNENPDRGKTAQDTLTILNHLNQRVKDVDSITDEKISKNLNWKIKMWDRVPQRDLFQGNYSTCCIGVGECNDHAMPHYLMNTSFNMIEVVDNSSGKTVGNALCYFVKDKDEKPAFVIDNIEINNGHKTSDETGKKLRDSIAEYASKVAKDVTGQDDIHIYLGDDYNDVPTNDLKNRNEKLRFWVISIVIRFILTCTQAGLTQETYLNQVMFMCLGNI